MRGRKLISLLAGVAAAWSFEALAQESVTMPVTSTSTSPQITIVHVKPVEVDRSPPNPRLGDDSIDLMKDFSLSSAQAIGGDWQTPSYLSPATPFDERYGQW